MTKLIEESDNYGLTTLVTKFRFKIFIETKNLSIFHQQKKKIRMFLVFFYANCWKS